MENLRDGRALLTDEYSFSKLALKPPRKKEDVFFVIMYGFEEKKLKPANLWRLKSTKQPGPTTAPGILLYCNRRPLFAFISDVSMYFPPSDWMEGDFAKQVKGYSLGQHARFVLVLLVVSKLDLDLESRKLDGVLQPHRMRPFQNCLLCLLIQQVELDRIPDTKF